MSKQSVPIHTIDEVFTREFTRELVENTSADGIFTIEAELEVTSDRRGIKIYAAISLIATSILVAVLAYILSIVIRGC